MSTTNYPAIRLWGKHLGSFQSYIEQQVKLAEKDEAPATSLYKGGDGWITLRELENVALLRDLTIGLCNILHHTKGSES